ncbi:uncharacterized protein K02A2.6-like [Eupeodes corollae]|uniref:uncharacterized protein K02A2.6-like n=1 Tax=Eupeodes corollae TaxID=290404 RepID=UPI002492AD02|nr:uncharacterized protein K02A2.6-like [Eupeodes corollae]
MSVQMEKLKQKYFSVFENSMGIINNVQARIPLRAVAKPVFIKARKMPFALRDAVEKEFYELEKNGIIEKFETSRWATPIVPVRKQGGKVRICGDYKISLNPQIFVQEHPLPTIEELFAAMAGEVYPDDREHLTLSTHRGLYRPTRFMYGVASGPAKWQNIIEEILKDIDCVSVFSDDIKITAPNDVIHLQRLEEVLSRLSKYNMRVNFEKCEFSASEIEYCEYKIDCEGIHKSMQ